MVLSKAAEKKWQSHELTFQVYASSISFICGIKMKFSGNCGIELWENMKLGSVTLMCQDYHLYIAVFCQFE